MYNKKWQNLSIQFMSNINWPPCNRLLFFTGGSNTITKPVETHFGSISRFQIGFAVAESGMLSNRQPGWIGTCGVNGDTGFKMALPLCHFQLVSIFPLSPYPSLMTKTPSFPAPTLAAPFQREVPANMAFYSLSLACLFVCNYMPLF